MSRDLILGLAAGYHYGDVRPFLSSLDHTGSDAMRVLFVSDTTRDIQRMRDHGAIVVPLTRSAGLEEIPYNGLRYFLYLKWLEQHDGPFDRILISDVRDVIFQRDPFAFPWGEGINAILEDRRITLGQCPYNSRWVRDHLGGEALDRIAGAPISCSGTTVGDHEGMLDYLRRMTGLLLPPSTAKGMAGYDQGVHNHLVHSGALPRLTLHDNSGPILTLAQTLGEPGLDARGQVLNVAGEPAFLVHQYDRKPALFKRLRLEYGS